MEGKKREKEGRGREKERKREREREKEREKERGKNLTTGHTDLVGNDTQVSGVALRLVHLPRESAS